MSSHHVVKEKQEPALIIANGAECEWDLMGQVLEWSPFIIVLDGAVKRVLELGLHFDAILGDFDSFTDLNALKFERPELEIIHAPDQSKTDLEKAMDFLIAKEFPAVNILWATGKRTDHTFNNIISMTKFTPKITWKLIDNHGLIYPAPLKYKKFFNQGAIISLFGIPEALEINSKNLKYPLHQMDLRLPSSGNSNEAAEDGIVELSYRSGCLIIMESKD